MSDNRFVAVPFDLLDSTSYGKLVILSDWKYWAEHEDDLKQWCKDHNASYTGMTVTMDEKSLTAFVLKWQ